MAHSMTDEGKQFDSSRAELFEALGHPSRVKILKALERNPLGFADLKREVGIESSGHLQFHLSKLGGLIGTTPEGKYALTDEGKEAIRVLTVTSGSGEIAARARDSFPRRINHTRAIIAVLLVSLIVLAGVAVYQEQQITALNLNPATGIVTIGDRTYYYEILPPNGGNRTSVTFHGVTFTFASSPFAEVKYSNPMDYTAQGSVRLSNGTVLNVDGKTVREEFQISSLPGCWNSLDTNNTATGQPHYGTLWIPPTISVAFPDRSQQVYNAPDVTAQYEGTPGIPGATIWLSYTITSPPNPWFGLHTNPQAGIFFDCTSPQGALIVYVSQ